MPLKLRDPDFVIWQDDQIYLKRWWVIPRNKRFNIYLHQFLHSDDDRACHDHPWWSISIILTKGGYFEHLANGGMKWFRSWRPYFRSAKTAHRVELIRSGRPVWTIFITGPVVREWGFHCPNGWVHWKKFVQQIPGGNKAGPGCGA